MTPNVLGRIVAALAGPLLVLAAGCGDEPMNDSPTPIADADKPVLRKVIGEKTQNVLDLKEEQAKNPGEGQVSDLKIKNTDYITIQGNAYVASVGKIAVDQITYAIRLFEATEGRYPKDYDEFMERIIRENNIALPQLPGYQEYAYDGDAHKLVVLEYPARKEALKEQVRGDH